MSDTPSTEYPFARRIDLAFQVMSYNQGFVMFVDGKANSLLVVNSIILATSGSSSLMGSRLALAALASATVAILLCLSVVFARHPNPAKRDKSRLAFYAHILQRNTWSQYQHDLEEVEPDQLLASFAHQVHDLAAVVDKKFHAYRRAQSATFVATGLWIASMAVPLLRNY
ncbi:MAG TPA: Pycsar system effector family protein [Myxococcales bacterium]|jgi:hypothetical protein